MSNIFTDTYKAGTKTVDNVVFNNLRSTSNFVIFSLVLYYISTLWNEWDALNVTGGWNDLRNFFNDVVYYGFFSPSIFIIMFAATMWGLNNFGFRPRALTGLLFVVLIAAFIQFLYDALGWNNFTDDDNITDATVTYLDDVSSELLFWDSPNSVNIFAIILAILLYVTGAMGNRRGSPRKG